MIIYFWFLYLLLFPFQIFSPGSLQVSDYIILIGVLINYKNIYKVSVYEKYPKMLLYFCLYSLFIGITFSLLNSDLIFIKNPINYFYCLLFLYFLITVSHKETFFKFTLFGILFSTIIQFLIFLKYGTNSDEIRMSLFFNNPNQLGFWALNYFLILILLKTQTIYINSKIIYVPLILCVLFIIISISQAAILSILLFIIYFIFIFLRKRIFLAFILLILVTLLSIKFYTNINNVVIVKNAIERVSDDQTNDDLDDNGLEGRNYLRLINYPKYLFFGSAEGLNSRFGNKDMNEVHSSFANLLFSYGIVGFIFFTIPYLYIISNKNLFTIVCFGIYLVFTLVHSTLRWPLFWAIPYLLFYIDKKRSYVWN